MQVDRTARGLVRLATGAATRHGLGSRQGRAYGSSAPAHKWEPVSGHRTVEEAPPPARHLIPASSCGLKRYSGAPWSGVSASAGVSARPSPRRAVTGELLKGEGVGIAR